MRCILMVYFVATIFLIVHSLPEPCVIEDWPEVKAARCEHLYVKYTFHFIPPVYQNISYISLLGQPLKQLPYNAFRNVSSQSSISRIWLSHCQISRINADALLNLHNLTTIHLTYNDITHIDSNLFSHTKQIQTIFMGRNKIEVLPSGLFQNLTLLKAVHLNGNRIRQVERFSFKNTPSLRIIDLSDNQIEFMSILFKDKFDNFKRLSLHGNPWKCDCELGPLYEFIKMYQLNLSGPVCEKPPTLHGRNWSDMSGDEFVCSSEHVISTQDSAMTSTEPVDTGIPQPVDSGIPQPPLNQNWILYTILVLVRIGVAVLTIGVVFLVRHTLGKSHKRRHVLLPTIVKRRSLWRTNPRQMDTGIPMRVIQSSAVLEDSDSASNADVVDEEETSIHQYAIREATIN